MRYRCLVMDHDDTVVNSTKTVHFPCFQEYMALKRPDYRISLEEYFKLNFDPGVYPLFHDIIGLNEQEMKEEQEYWSEYCKTHKPKAYPGIRELLWKQKESGGLIAVVSHSYSEYIYRDYEENGLPKPDLVFGWEVPKERRKPEPHSIYEIMDRFCLKPGELCVVDDLRPGYEMARSAGVPFLAAGWSNSIPEIRTFMQAHADSYFAAVSDLYNYLNS